MLISSCFSPVECNCLLLSVPSGMDAYWWLVPHRFIQVYTVTRVTVCLLCCLGSTAVGRLTHIWHPTLKNYSVNTGCVTQSPRRPKAQCGWEWPHAQCGWEWPQYDTITIFGPRYNITAILYFSQYNKYCVSILRYRICMSHLLRYSAHDLPITETQ